MFTVNASRGSGSPSLSHLRPTLRFTVTAFEGLGSPFQRGHSNCLRCESKSFLQGCHANKHSKRCAKSHVLDRRASCPAVPTLTSIRTITFLQHTLRTLAHIRDHQNNARKSHIDTGIRLTATSFPAPSSIWRARLLKICELGYLELPGGTGNGFSNFFGGEPKSSV